MAIWFGGNGNDKRNGTAEADRFFGMAGNDTLNGGGGNDVLDGNTGNDVVNGGAGLDVISILGSDTLTGGSGMDFFTTTGSPINLHLPSNSSVITDFKATGPGHDILQLFNFDVSWKDRDADTNDRFSITKSGTKDVLVTISDKVGDTFKILLKNVALKDLSVKNLQVADSPFPFAPKPDAVAPQAASDLFWEGTPEDDAKSGGRGNDFLIGLAGNDTLRGMGGNDGLNGQAGADVLFGNAGDDRIYVSGGDRATGGAGADTFVFLSAAAFPDITDSGRAVITDFTATGSKVDKIELVGFDVTFDDADKGLDDGFEMVQSGDNVLIRLLDSDGATLSLVLKDTLLADLGESHFDIFML